MLAPSPPHCDLWKQKCALAREILGEKTLLREGRPDLSQDRSRFDLMFFQGKLGVRGPKKNSNDWDFEFTEDFDVSILNPSLRVFIEEIQGELTGWSEFFHSAQVRFRFDGKGRYGLWIDTRRDELERFSKSQPCLDLQKKCLLELGQRQELVAASPHAWLPSFSKDNEEIPLLSYIASFSQPGPEANRALIAFGLELLEGLSIDDWVEIGAGYGNLTAAYATLLGCPNWILEKEGKESHLWESNKKYFASVSMPQKKLTKLYSQAVETFTDAQQADLLVADPPRSGFSEFFQKDIVQAKAVLLYSCDLKGLLRDSTELKKHYELVKWSLVDLFPGTPYVEAITLWQRKNV